MRAAGVPVIPGCDAVADVEEAKAQAEKIGFPLLIKARAGGGGRGIRLVKEASELEAAYQNASREALSAFGDGGVYMENICIRQNISRCRSFVITLEMWYAWEKGNVRSSARTRS